MEQLGHLLGRLLECRPHDMRGRLVVELLNAFAEIGFGDLNAAALEERPQVAFLGEHRLRLHQVLGTVRVEDVVDDLVVLMGVARPVHRRTVAHRAGLEHLQVTRQVGQRVLFDLGRERAQVLPLGHLARRGVAAHAQPPDQRVERAHVGLVLEEFEGDAGLIDRFHRASPFRISARCTNWKSSPEEDAMRLAQPCRCIRHDMSADTM